MNILYHSVSGIGNNLNASPAVQALNKLFPMPEHRIDILSLFPELWLSTGLCNESLKIGDPPPNIHYDLVVQSIFHADEELEGYQYNRIVRAPREHVTRIHEIQSNLAAVKSLGYDGETPKRVMAEPKTGRERFIDTECLIGITPGGRSDGPWDRKKWPHFKKLIEKIIYENMANLKVNPSGLNIVILGGEFENKEDWQFEDEFISRHVKNRIGMYSLMDTAFALKQCRMVITNDCGPGHMAAVMGIKTYFLWGPTSLVKNMPVEDNCTIIYKGMDCQPCQFTPNWNTCRNFECMDGLTVDTVYQRIDW